MNVSGVYRVRPRIIFMTDGCPTDEGQETGPDLPGNLNQVMALGFLLLRSM